MPGQTPGTDSHQSRRLSRHVLDRPAIVAENNSWKLKCGNLKVT